MAPKTGRCSWLLCCGKGSVHPEPADEDDTEPETDPKPVVVAPPPPTPPQKHPELLNSEGHATDTCRYYCPLCFDYFEAAYETVCCGHTICDECALGYMRSASIRGPVVLDQPPAKENWVCGDTITIFDGISAQLPNACPFCRETMTATDLPKALLEELGTAEGFQLKLVLAGAEGGMLRSYEDSPGGSQHQDRSGRFPSLPGAVSVGPSPLRVGDSFEKMKAKMVPFEQRPPPVPSGVVRANSLNTTPRTSALPEGLEAPADQRPMPANPVLNTPVGAARPTNPFVQTPGGQPVERMDAAVGERPLIEGEISVAAAN